jgi:hypothetical protein
VIPVGLMLDCRVTLFPDLPALRFDADMLMIIGKERFLIDYTQTPVSWGCDASGNGCLFELTGYDHTPAQPEGPRFYINVVFKKSMEGGVDLSAEEMFGATGKEPMTDDGGRRRRDHRQRPERQRRYGTKADSAQEDMTAAQDKEQAQAEADAKTQAEADAKTQAEAEAKAEAEAQQKTKIVSLYAAADTWLEGSSAQGTRDLLIVGKEAGYSKKRSLVQVPLEAFDNGAGRAGSGATRTEAAARASLAQSVVKATLRVRLRRPYSARSGGDVISRQLMASELLVPFAETQASTTVRVAGSGWQPAGTLSYKDYRLNPDVVDQTAAAVTTFMGAHDSKTPTAFPSWIEWDVTAAVKSWIQNPATNHGLLLWATNEDTDGADLRFQAREFDSKTCLYDSKFTNAEFVAMCNREQCKEGQVANCKEFQYCPYMQQLYGSDALIAPHLRLQYVPDSPAAECMAGAVSVDGTCQCPADLTRTPCRNTQGFCCVEKADCEANAVNAADGTCECPAELVKTECDNTQGFCCVKPSECEGDAVLVGGNCECPEELVKTECDNRQGFCCVKPSECEGDAVLVGGNCECPKELAKAECDNRQGFCCVPEGQREQCEVESERGCPSARCSKPDGLSDKCTLSTLLFVSERTTPPLCCKESCVWRLGGSGAKCDATNPTKATVTTTLTTVTTTTAAEQQCYAGAVLDSSGVCVCPKQLVRASCKNIQGFCCNVVEVKVCSREVKRCADGRVVHRDPDNKCQFAVCPGTGTTPNGTPCTCDCDVCDAFPVFVPKPVAGTQLLAATHVESQAACQRSCAVGVNCQSVSFTSTLSSRGRRRATAQRSFFKTLDLTSKEPNCKLFATKASGRMGRAVALRRSGDSRRAVEATADIVTHFNVEASETPPAFAYEPLSGYANHHHTGATLLWTAAATAAECQQRCDATVKCQGVSLYEGVADDRNCRLIGDTMITGPWIDAANGPWSTKRIAALAAPPVDSCKLTQLGGGGGSAADDFGTDQWRWDETVAIASFSKTTDADGKTDELYATPPGRTSDQIFVGETLAWAEADTAEECLAECTAEPECHGVTFYPEGDGLGAARCKLAASSMDGDDGWITDPEAAGEAGGRRARFGRLLVHLKKMVAKVKLIKKDCTCKVAGGGGGGDDDNGVGGGGGDDDDSTTDDGAPSTGGSTDCNGCEGSAALAEIGGDLDPNESRLLISARTKILGLEKKLKVEITKHMAMIRMEGALFGTFLQTYFGVDIAFQKPRSFRCYGGLKMESKDAIIAKVKASLQSTADDANAAFEAADAKLETAKQNTIGAIAAKQAELDSKRSIFEAKAAQLQSKAAAMQAKAAELAAKKSNLDNICQIRCCTKSCAGNWAKRRLCDIANVACHIVRAVVLAAYSVAQVALNIAAAAYNVAAAAVNAAQVVLDIAIAALEVVKAVVGSVPHACPMHARASCMPPCPCLMHAPCPCPMPLCSEAGLCTTLFFLLLFLEEAPSCLVAPPCARLFRPC